MTTIACDRKSMAADTAVNTGERIQKIHTLPDGALIGHAGALFAARRILAWMCGEEPRPPDGEETDVEFLILSDSGIYICDATDTRVPLLSDYWAIGTGADYAIGAMAQGATPEQAVAVACQFDAGSRLPVVTEKLVKRSKLCR